MKGNKLFKQIDRFIGVPLLFLLGTLVHAGHWFHRGRSLQIGDRVLTVKLSALGDTFILLPALKAIKQTIGPTGKLYVLVTPINKAALDGFCYAEEVLVLDFGRFLKDPKALWSFLVKLRSLKPHFALDFDQWLRISPLLCLFSGASQRIGFKTPGQARHYTYHRTIPNVRSRHEFDQFISIAESAGVPFSSVDAYNGFLEKEGLYRKTDAVAPKKGLIHIHPGCGSYGWQRAWPEAHYIRLIQKLSTDAKLNFRLTGMGAYEENLVRTIIRSAGGPIEDRSGKLTLSELADLLREADLVICGNTGVLHLAAGLGRPLVTMNGPANAIKWGALGPRHGEKGGEIRQLFATVPCSPCTTLGYEYGCPARPCMESISVEQVHKECLRLLGKN